jgi:GNAT superfamily N-acetyltransferase
VVSGFRARDARIFRPYPDEVPWDLLESVGADSEVLRQVQEQNLVRVAKLQERVIAAYAIRPLTPTCFELVALAVAEGYRGKGLGRWLLGHAIGLAESRGAREIRFRGPGLTPRQTFLTGVGFVESEGGLLLTLTPE